MRIYKILFDTKERKERIEYIYAFAAQDARDKVSEMYPDCCNVEIIARYN